MQCWPSHKPRACEHGPSAGPGKAVDDDRMWMHRWPPTLGLTSCCGTSARSNPLRRRHRGCIASCSRLFFFRCSAGVRPPIPPGFWRGHGQVVSFAPVTSECASGSAAVRHCRLFSDGVWPLDLPFAGPLVALTAVPHGHYWTVAIAISVTVAIAIFAVGLRPIGRDQRGDGRQQRQHGRCRRRRNFFGGNLFAAGHSRAVSGTIGRVSAAEHAADAVGHNPLSGSVLVFRSIAEDHSLVVSQHDRIVRRREHVVGHDRNLARPRAVHRRHTSGCRAPKRGRAALR